MLADAKTLEYRLDSIRILVSSLFRAGAMKINTLVIAWIFVVATFALHGHCQENWPQFRGPEGAGIAANPDRIPRDWSASKNLVWKTELPGKGSSSPIIWENRIFVTSFSGYGESKENPGDRAMLKRHLICRVEVNVFLLFAADRDVDVIEREHVRPNAADLGLRRLHGAELQPRGADLRRLRRR